MEIGIVVSCVFIIERIFGKVVLVYVLRMLEFGLVMMGIQVRVAHIQRIMIFFQFSLTL